MRTQTFDVPPQEVTFAIKRAVRDIFSMLFSDLDEGQRDSVCKCDNVLQGEKDCNHLYISPGPTSLTLTPLPPSPSSPSSPSSFSQSALSGEGCNERGGKCGRL